MRTTARVISRPDQPCICRRWNETREPEGTIAQCEECGRYIHARCIVRWGRYVTAFVPVRWWNIFIWDQIINAERPERGPLGFDIVEESQP